MRRTVQKATPLAVRALPRLVATLVAGALLLAVTAAQAGLTPEQRCQVGKNKLVGKYVLCRQNAEATRAASGNTVKFTSAIKKCETGFVTAWQKLEGKAATAQTSCLDGPATASTFQPLVDDYTSHMATALAGGALSKDCLGDLGTCQDDLDTCQATPTAQLLKTGQTTSYGTETDGNVQKGVARSYVTNPDGTITDLNTGLMWEKKSDDDTIHDKDKTYSWGSTSPPYTMDGTVVTVFLDTLNAGSGFAGHTDWRIPNLNELQSLVNYEAVNPSVNAEFNTACQPNCTVTACSCTVGGLYWSATTNAMYPVSAWAVDFNTGGVNFIDKNNVNQFRAVRAGS